MTVCYTEEVATCRGIGNFYKLLFRWKGSIYKVVWIEVIVYLFCFYAIYLFYQFYLIHHCDQKRLFIDLIKYCDNYSKNIPVTFVLGFYVSIVVSRWWNQFLYLPWPDSLALTVSATVDGGDDRGRLIRRTLLRYANVSFVMGLAYMSVAGDIRFPTLRHMVEAGLLLEHERQVLDEMKTKTTGLVYWVPLVWAGIIARRARKEGKIKDDISLNNVITAINIFRRQNQEMLNYDWVNIPLVYTQVCTLAVYVYFLACLIGKQLTVINETDEPVDMRFPIFSFVEFFFYFGWLKVAECLINPYGEDDDDYEINWLIDRDFEVAYVIVDDMHQEHPNLLKDQYWDEVFPSELPYTEGTMKYKHAEGQVGSTRNIHVKKSDGTIIRSEQTLRGQGWGESKTDHTKRGAGSLVEEFAHRRASLTGGSSLNDGRGVTPTESTASAFRNRFKKKKGVGGQGYWGETGKSKHVNVNINELMEKDDNTYDSKKSYDEFKERK